MTWFRNLSASEVDRIKRSVNRAETKSPLRHGTMTEGVLRISGSGRIEFDGDANLPNIPLATPTRTGLMTAAYAAKLDATPDIQVSTSAGTRVTVGGTHVFYDSGLRDITSYGVNVSAGSSFQVRRTLESLILTYSFLFSSSGSGPLSFLGDLPSGWRPVSPAVGVGLQGGGLQRHDIRANSNGGASWNFSTDESGSRVQSRPTSGSRVEGTITMPAQSTLPGSLIGSPA